MLRRCPLSQAGLGSQRWLPIEFTQFSITLQLWLFEEHSSISIPIRNFIEHFFLLWMVWIYTISYSLFHNNNKNNLKFVLIRIWNKTSPSQRPSFVRAYPGWQSGSFFASHLKPPSTLTQFSNDEHLCVPKLHSSMSTKSELWTEKFLLLNICSSFSHFFSYFSLKCLYQ